ncbi:MAG: oligosaccharide flippase family protein [Tissierellia bacterium]|nr:oligosaccharide flippase family protein [Tissierellia bacterium]
MIKRIINSSLFQSAGIYTITSGINAAIPFLLIPILTRYMSPGDYGIISMFGVLVSFVAPFTGLSIHGAIQRQYYERDHIDLPKYVSNCILILLTSSALVATIFYIFGAPISRISSFPQQWLWLVVIISIAQFLSQVVLVLWQVQVKPLPYGIYQILQTLLNATLSVWFVVGLGLAWKGRIEAQVIAVTVFGAVAIGILYKNKWLKFSFNRNYICNALRFGVPLIPHTLGGVIITMTDRFFITNMVGLESTGLYTVGYQVGMIIGLLENAFTQAYAPWLFERLKADDNAVKIKIVKLTYYYFLSIIAVAVVLGLIAPWLLSFFVGKQFSGSSNFVLWIALGYSFDGMYKMVVGYIFYVEKTYILAWITFLCAVINVILNYILIKINGAIGAAQATTITFLLLFLLTWILSYHVYKMPWFQLKLKKVQ